MPRWYLFIAKTAFVRTPNPAALPRPHPSSVITCSRRLCIARDVPIAYLSIPRDTIHTYTAEVLGTVPNPAYRRLFGLLRWFWEVCHLGLTRHRAEELNSAMRVKLRDGS